MPITKSKKRHAAKKLDRNGKIAKIIAKVSEICDYAIDNLCTEPAQMEELECMLNEFIK